MAKFDWKMAKKRVAAASEHASFKIANNSVAQCHGIKLGIWGSEV